MKDPSLLGLIQNAGLLLVVAFIFDWVTSSAQGIKSKARQALAGFALGTIGIAVMLTPWMLEPGILFDTRSVLLGISGLFFGLFPASIAMAMTAAFRFYQGGVGVWTGIAVILASGLTGLAWRHLRRHFLTKISWLEIYLFGIVVHVVMLSLMFTLPWTKALDVLSNIALPVLLIYPAGTALLGVLMVNRFRREQVETVLKESESKYRLLADNINDVIFVLDMDLNYTYVSPSVKMLRGYEPEEVLKQTTKEALVPASWELAVKSLSEVMELEKSEHRDISISRMLQLELKRKDGTTVWTEVHFSFIRDEDQHPVGILGITRDITERKLIETTQDRLLYILESNLSEIYTFDSESLAFEYVNRGALANLGYTLEDMRRMTPVDLKPAFTEETFRQTIQPLLQHKQEQLIFETTHKRADGSLYPAEVHLQIVELGKQRLFLAMIVDISERKAAEAEQRRTEESLRESEAMLSRAQEIAHIGSWKLDLTTNHLTWSDEVYRIFGCQPQEFAATYETFLDFTHPDDRTAVDEAYSRSLRDGSDSYEIEHRIIRLGAGDVRYVHERCVHTRDEAGTIIQSIGMVQDITERKRAEAELAEQIHELRRWHNVMLDREDRVIELKKEVNALMKQTGNEEKYKIIE